MSETTPRSTGYAEGSFRYEALLYDGEAGFVAQLGSFLRDAVVALEPTLVVVSARKIGLLREERIEHALAGGERPVMDEPGGRGLWIANQLRDLVQVRSFPTGSAVRLHMRRG